MAGKKKGYGLVSEFKQFITRGNVMDLAVGVIIGGAFQSIVTSLVNDIFMPFIGIFIGKDSFSNLAFSIGTATISIGNFIQAVINFLILALVIFCLVKAVNRFHKNKEEAPPPQPKPSPEEVLLTEIRDLLKEQAQ